MYTGGAIAAMNKMCLVYSWRSDVITKNAVFPCECPGMELANCWD